MKRKKPKSERLPRVTLMCMSKRDLVAFVAAVETLKVVADDVRVLVNALVAERAARTAKKRPAAKPAAEDVPPFPEDA